MARKKSLGDSKAAHRKRTPILKGMALDHYRKADAALARGSCLSAFTELMAGATAEGRWHQEAGHAGETAWTPHINRTSESFSNKCVHWGQDGHGGVAGARRTRKRR